MVLTGFEFLLRNTTHLLYKTQGVARVIIPREEAISSVDGDLNYFDCLVTFNKRNILVESSVISFESDEDVDVESVFGDLNVVASPFVVRSLAYGTGLGEFSKDPFLVVPRFTSTLAPYIHENWARAANTFDKQRFTEEFIAIIRDVVYAIFTLHEEGFYCPELAAKHILIFSADTTKTAQIWKFSYAGSWPSRLAATTSKHQGDDDVKQTDWSRLGGLIIEATKQHLIATVEINDLCNRLVNGTLQGLEILKHSALLTVQQKFENILALNLYILVHSEDDFEYASQASGKCEAVAALKKFINESHSWRNKVPDWIKDTSGYQPKTNDTGRSFVDWLRDRVEHELSFIREQDQQKKSIEVTQKYGKNPDLECEVRMTWEKLFLEVQNLVNELGIRY